MLLAKQELLAALAAELDRLSPGSGSKASFESPKVAAHGDLACTAAMQLAKPLKQNPRQLAEALRNALLATPAFARWVEAIEIAGPGFLNIRLRPWIRRLLTRLVAIVPAVIVAAKYGESGVGQLLILSQVILSLQLSFAVVPLVLLRSVIRSPVAVASMRAWRLDTFAVGSTMSFTSERPMVITGWSNSNERVSFLAWTMTTSIGTGF